MSDNRYIVIEEVGMGAFSNVFKVVNQLDNQLYAQKRVKLTNNNDKLHNEISIIKTCSDCKHIIKCHDIYWSDTHLYMIMDLACASLFHIIISHFNGNIINDEHLKYYIYHISRGLEYLHDKDIIYRDLKPENVLVMFDGQVKLADFGLSVVSIHDRKTVCGTVEFMAPEIIFDHQYNQSVDIFSLGVLVYEMIYTRHPFFAVKTCTGTKGQLALDSTNLRFATNDTSEPQNVTVD